MKIAEIINEVKMSPSRLKKEAEAIPGVLAGIEFEMVADGESESIFQKKNEAYPGDVKFTDIKITTYTKNVVFDAITEFFKDVDENVQHVFSEIKRQYLAWCIKQQEYNQWLIKKTNKKYQDNAALRKAILKSLGQIDVESLHDELLNDAQIEELPITPKIKLLATKLKMAFLEDCDTNSKLFLKYLNYLKFRSMKDISAVFSLPWPHQSPEDYADIINDFKKTIGRRISISPNYHGAERGKDNYAIEPDMSIKSKKTIFAGVEFVSPPLPLDEMIHDLHTVIDWANSKGWTTNESTGLHMNVSIPSLSRDSLDYIKLALFLGDERILSSFGRLGNTMCVSAMTKIKTRLGYQSSEKIIDQLRNTLVTEISKTIHSAYTEKYTSINIHENYIELRSPGGDWLNKNVEHLEEVLYKLVVAIDIACNPEKHKNEYLKRFYKLVAGPAKEDPVFKIMSYYLTGKISKDELKYYLVKNHDERNSYRYSMSHHNVSLRKFFEVVYRPDLRRITVTAMDRESAIKQAKRQWPDLANEPDSQFAIQYSSFSPQNDG